MKQILVLNFLLFGLFGYSQQQKTAYKKPVKVKEVETKTIEAIQESNSEPPIEQIQQEKKQEEPTNIVEKLLSKNGWIKNRNSVYVRGIEAFIKGTYVNKDKIFIMVEVWNRTNINYDIESVSFVTTPIKSKGKYIVQEEKIFIPIETYQSEMLEKKSKNKFIYVFDKFTISDNVNLMFLMDEENGDRSINLPIKTDYIINSEYIK